MLLFVLGCFPELNSDHVADVPWRDDDGDGFSADEGDCADDDIDSYPGAPELDDGVDNDCDETVDEGLVDTGCLVVWFLDQDGDGWGGETEVLACDRPDGTVDRPGDCDDGNYARSPGWDEDCGNDLDEDCDGLAPTCPWLGDQTLVDVAAASYAGSSGAYAGRSVSAGDLNGDGFPDLAVGADQEEAVHLFWGPFEGELVADATLTVPAQDGRLGKTTLIHDVTGDGELDLLVAAPYWDSGRGVVHLFTGPVESGEQPSLSLPEVPFDSFGSAMAVGRWADGERLVITSPTHSGFGRVQLYDLPLTGTPALEMQGDEGSLLGDGVVLTPDTDGDGLSELVISSYIRNTVYLVTEPEHALKVSAGSVQLYASAGQAGYGMADCDVNGDGKSDLLISSGEPNQGRAVYLVEGPVASMNLSTAATSFVGPGYFGRVVTCLDLDGSGLDDVVIPDLDGKGAVYVYYDPPAGSYDATMADVRFVGEDGAGEYLFALGDVGGDAEEDLAVASQLDNFGGGNRDGAVHLVFGAGL